MLTLASHNRGVAQPFRTGRERRERRASLGLVCHDGGRALERKPLSVAEQYRLAAERRAQAGCDDYVQAPCDVE
jgi:hypothetical protein